MRYVRLLSLNVGPKTVGRGCVCSNYIEYRTQWLFLRSEDFFKPQSVRVGGMHCSTTIPTKSPSTLTGALLISVSMNGATWEAFLGVLIYIALHSQ